MFCHPLWNKKCSCELFSEWAQRKINGRVQTRRGGGGVTGVLIVPLLGVKKRFGIPPFKAFSIKMTRDRRECLVLELVPLHPLRSGKYLLHFKPTLKHNLGDFFQNFRRAASSFYMAVSLRGSDDLVSAIVLCSWTRPFPLQCLFSPRSKSILDDSERSGESLCCYKCHRN